ncbi:S1C family serine protease [Streptomyces griseoviridis]|uniref:PDZ domain-containing protein n=2 Tax=Streptomyces TaxID=1883 RepID=A0A3S9ZIN8_STRGD|nr:MULTISPECIES: trypsin-like peptidase domain-containing protein [Streptomyces]AZS87725.1 PDZ domain-containing protein [Streptomyces griseoviridis]MDH6698104.1 putative serine protease PepD [Streptomyces sp. MAA16]MDT0475250.1 trypsin-like peptidase domain-containing protein [Streptomyces sp. DSM 41014]QCN85430.1 signal protein PDZ [Streptomyces griseoviridis]
MDASRTRARRPFVPLAALACSLALLSGCSGLDDAAGEEGTTAQAARARAPRSGTDLQSDYLKVIKDVLPSVVQIQARSDLGSGVVFDDQGHIVTNAHVVGSQKTFKVTAANTEEALSARLVYSYPEQDLAVVKLDKVPHGLRAATFGDSAKVEVGQLVLAMGSPLGLSSSVTEGIVSATGRTVTEGSSGGGTGATIGNMVQTSAAINPGNSGGALVNLAGQVIGIPTLAATDPDLGGSAAPGIGFAIPGSMVKTVADQIVKDGKVTDSGRAALGITGRTVVNDDYQAAGVAVAEVKAGGAAAKAGIESGDIIIGLDATPITTITSLTEALAAERPGAKVTVTYTRNGSRKKADVTLGEQ